MYIAPEAKLVSIEATAVILASGEPAESAPDFTLGSNDTPLD